VLTGPVAKGPLLSVESNFDNDIHITWLIRLRIVGPTQKNAHERLDGWPSAHLVVGLVVQEMDSSNLVLLFPLQA
jgi:hypothetical protein